MTKSHADYTIAIICAMEFEMSAVRYMLDKEDPPLSRRPGDLNTYLLGEMRGHNVVLACLPSQQGKGAAAIVATNLSRTFESIKLRLFVGIGGGVPKPPKQDVRLGDVVIGMPEGQYGGVVQYDLGKETETDGSSDGFVLKGFLRPPPAALVGAVEAMRSNHWVHDNKINQFVEEMLKKGRRLVAFRRPSPDLDVLFQSDCSHVVGPENLPCAQKCDNTKAVLRAPREDALESVIHYGLIASGDSVIKNAVKRDAISGRVGGNVLCFEMEAAGLMTGFECLVIRGISDYCDSHKNDSWHHYAAAAAAACAKEVLERLGSDKEDVESSSQNQHRLNADVSDEARNNAGVQDIYKNQTNTMSGTGIQHTGPGNFSVGGSLNIGR